ncbi:hypothetical protein CTAYLR_004136 [Chrysophaeum taylorii]|uniref:Protein kinase domain-containing protein n=1 Tax=Chrysophaeum taylorii TaxID=2483200 RepID=A0AAD7XT54_9STRA|nr:hypothetical protein CTAYLR_004136 [Chrysophaeum taylorii]
MPGTKIRVVVPPGYGPGSMMHVENPMDGSRFCVVVPPNGGPGMALDVSPPPQTANKASKRKQASRKPIVPPRPQTVAPPPEAPVGSSRRLLHLKQGQPPPTQPPPVAEQEGAPVQRLKECREARPPRTERPRADSNLAHVSVCVIAGVIEVASTSLPFGDAVRVLVAKFVETACLCRENDAMLEEVGRRVERVGSIVDDLVEHNAPCAKNSKSFQALVDTLIKLVELAAAWEQKTLARRMWKAREYKEKFTFALKEMSNCVDELTLAVSVEARFDAAELRSHLDSRLSGVETWMASQSYELRQLQFTTRTLVDRIDEMTKSRGSPDEMKRLVRDLSTQTGANAGDVLRELQETLSNDLLDRAPVLFGSVLRDAGLTAEEVRDDRRRLVAISAEVGELKAGIAKFLDAKMLDDKNLADVMEDVAAIKKAVSKENSAEVRDRLSGLESRLDVDKQEILRELYKTKEALGASDDKFSRAFGADVASIKDGISRTHDAVMSLREEIKGMVVKLLDKTAGSSRTLDESIRQLDRASVSQTFGYIKRLSGSQGGSVPYGKFELAFSVEFRVQVFSSYSVLAPFVSVSALFLDGAPLGLEQKRALREAVDIDGDAEISVAEYTVFFQRWLASGTDAVKQLIGLDDKEKAEEPSSDRASIMSSSIRRLSSGQLADIVLVGDDGKYSQTVLEEGLTGEDVAREGVDQFLEHLGVTSTLHSKRIKARLSSGSSRSDHSTQHSTQPRQSGLSSQRGDFSSGARTQEIPRTASPLSMTTPDSFETLLPKLGLVGSIWACSPAEVSGWLDIHGLGGAKVALSGASGFDLLVRWPEARFDAALKTLPCELQGRVREAFEREGRTFYNLALRHMEESPMTRLCDTTWKGILGCGSFGQVHRVYDRTAHKDYAVKLQALNEPTRQRLGVNFAARSLDEACRELVALRGIESKHVVRVFEYGTVGADVVWALFEYCEGGDLKDRLERGWPSIIDSYRWTTDALRGVADIHAQGLSHRDIKTANCFLTKKLDCEAVCKLGDFGLAREATEKMSSIVGTKHNMAPELLQGLKYDTKADVWSLLVVAYELLARKPLLWSGKNEAELCDTVPPPETREGRLLRAWIKFDPTERPSATQLLDLVEIIQADHDKKLAHTESVSKEPPPLPPRPGIPPRPDVSPPSSLGCGPVKAATRTPPLATSTPLEAACRDGRLEDMVHHLETLGEHTAIAVSSALAASCGSGQCEAVCLLIERYGARADTACVMEACCNGQASVVAVLLQHGVSPAAWMSGTWSPYHTACFQGHTDCAVLLLAYGTDHYHTTQDGETGLFLAVSQRHCATIRELLDAHAALVKPPGTPNVVNYARLTDGFAPLHVAAVNDDAESVRMLLQHGANAAQADARGSAPCHIAARLGKIEAVRALAASSLELRDASGATPLGACCKAGRVNCAEALLACGAETDCAAEDGSTPLHFAVKNLDLARLLVAQYGADCQLTTNNGETALIKAAAAGAVDVAQLLMKHNARVDHRSPRTGETALMLASRNGHTELAHFLITAGANVNLASHQGETPLFAAASGGSVATLLLLLDHRAKLDQVTVDGRSVLWIAAKNGQLAAAEYLLQQGAPVATPDSSGLMPIHVACESESIDVIRLLIKHKTPINATTNEGVAPLAIAAERHTSIAVVRLLIDSGASVQQVDSKGLSPLYCAAREGHADIARLLLDRGADANRAANDGKAPIHAAAMRGHVQVARVLLDRGANVNAKYHGQTALTIASKYKNNGLIGLLKEYGAKKGKRFGII